MDRKHYDRIIGAREAMFRSEGKVLNPTTLAYDPKNPFVLLPDIRCVRCDSTLVTRAKAGLLELRAKIKGKWTRIYLSIFLEDYFVAVRDEDADLAPGETVEKVTCPECLGSLFHPTMECRRCETSLVGLDVRTFDGKQFVINICGRRGCTSHYIELGMYDFKKLFLHSFALRSTSDFEPLHMSGRYPRSW